MFFKSLTLSLFGLAYALTEDDARCHVFKDDPLCDNALACGYCVNADDVSQPCGATVDDACISTMFGVVWGSEDCGKCFRVTMENDHAPENCQDDDCPVYTHEVFLKIEDGNGGDVKFEMSQMAWSRLCPFLCHATEQCVPDASACAHGTVPDVGDMPGPCHARLKPIKYEEVPCSDTPTSDPAPTTTTTTTNNAVATTEDGKGSESSLNKGIENCLGCQVYIDQRS
eukprot:GHVO01043365.1.p1 GENE.GHVO01043365.1~~GHVO01043365.1.p1  ORF type:complete len:227 (-),score=25.91 GHVO01043365.1:67-747(-)